MPKKKDFYKSYICIHAHQSDDCGEWIEVGDVAMFYDEPDLDIWCATSNIIQDPKVALWNVCEKFIKDQDIMCPETIQQSDRVIENALEFIERICSVVGYCQDEE